MPERTVTEALHELTAATHEFTASVQGISRQQQGLQRRQHLMLVLLFVMLAGLLTAGLVAYRLYDCTTPGGGCYRQSMRQTGKAVQQLNAHGDQRAECIVTAHGDLAAYRACLAGRH
jgi:hypothetical protein